MVDGSENTEKIPGIWRHKDSGRLFKDIESWDGYIFVFISEFILWMGDMEGFNHRFERIDHGEG